MCKRRPPALVVMMRAETCRLLWKASNFFLLREDRRGTRAHRQKVRGLLSVAQAFYHDTSLPYRFADQEMMKNMANARNYGSVSLGAIVVFDWCDRRIPIGAIAVFEGVPRSPCCERKRTMASRHPHQAA